MKAIRFDEIELGRSERFMHRFAESDIDDFARLSGDTSPIHMSQPAAADRRFSTRVVHGLLTASLLSRLVGVELPGSTALLHRVDVSFLKPVFPGDELVVNGTVCGRVEAYRQIEIKAWIENQRGDAVAKAKIWVGLSE